MDNASKALIIAGAVLIAVMLVSVGVAIYQQAQGVVDQGQSSMNALEIKMANAKYTTYEKEGQNRNAIVQLLNQVIQGYKQNDEHVVFVTIKAKDGSGVTMPTDSTLDKSNDVAKITKARDVIRKTTNLTYNVTTETDNSGYIDHVKIEAQH